MAKGKKTGGRQKGTPNKMTAEMKEAVETAFQNVGGVAYLERVAEEHPTSFCTLLGRILPKQIDVDANVHGSLTVEIIDPTKDGDV